MRTIGPLAGILAVALVCPAWGADHGLEGLKVVIRARGSATKVAFASKDPSVLFPAIGSADDPASGTPGGATIDFVTAGTVAAVQVPGGAGWTVEDGALDVYRFRDPFAPAGSSAVRSLTLRQGRVLKFTVKDASLPMTAPLGGVGVRVTMGSVRSCALFDASTIVVDRPGRFVARGTLLSIPADCSDFSLGLASVCGNGLVEPGEACDGGADTACPGHCGGDCTCSPYCGDGRLDAGEQCDGTEFGPAAACTYEPFLGAPACQPDCQCCALLACSAFNFDIPCCPGYVCPQRIGPNQITFCRRACQVDANCDLGDVCLGGECRTPNCSSSADCGGGICVGVCCYDVPGFGFVCG